MLFGDRLKILREEKDITQKELGNYVGISDRVIGYYESNDRFPKDENVLKKIAEYFNVSLDYLMGVTNTRTSYGETPEERKAKVKSLRDELVNLMIKQGLIKDIDDIDEHMLKIIEASIKTYAEVTNNKRKDHE